MSDMPSPTLLLILLTIIIRINDAVVVGGQQFVYNGFENSSLLLGGAGSITQDGTLSLTNGGSYIAGHGFHPERFRMVDHNGRSTAMLPSFSATFVFTANPYFSGRPGDEMAFMMSSTTDDLTGALPESDAFFAIVLGVNLKYPICISSSPTGYSYVNDLDNVVVPENEALVKLSGGKPVQLWVDYDGASMKLNVTMALAPMHEPSSLLLSSYSVNLSSLLLGKSFGEPYVGFSASTGDTKGSITHQEILGWSFSLDGPAQPLNYSLLPAVPSPAVVRNKTAMKDNLVKWLPATVVVLLAAACLVIRWWRNKRAARLEEGWEAELGPRRFSHKDLHKATNGFSSRRLLGKGGFGRVYGGTLAAASGGVPIAVKQISSESNQGLAQFMAEVAILGRLRHRNLVRLIGYCRRKDELFVVYEHMSNGSLDRCLHNRQTNKHKALIWSKRFHIIKGIASGLLYLHEDWEQVIVHRDVKASNVLLDDEMNGRLGDFGLARLHGHGVDAHTTLVAGTRGYLAPELLRFGKATKATDVFAFGMFILEVACGRQPMGLNARWEPLELANWVRQVWASRSIIDAMDSRLEDYDANEAELVLKLGLLCSHPLPAARPSMRLAMQYLDGDLPLPEFSLDYLIITDLDQVIETSPSSVATTITCLSGGR